MQSTSKGNWGTLLLLILSGEAIFLLPFVVVRIFRPTFLNVFEIDNTQLGWCFSAYGIVALISYFLGGFFADRFAPRFLMAISLFATAAGGFFLLSLPSPNQLILLYAFWGATTILLFWAPLIKSTRNWGASKHQALAFGLLDGGRGAIAALIGIVGIAIFALDPEVDTSQLTSEERIQTFQKVLRFVSIFVALTGLLVLLFLREKTSLSKQEKLDRNALVQLLRNPRIWYVMVIVLTGYVGYKCTDFFPQYAQDVMGMNEVDASKMGTLLLICRPITAVAIALIGDRFLKSTLVKWTFAFLFIAASLTALGWVQSEFTLLFVVNMLLTGMMAYSIRALYFSLLEEGHFAIASTGLAVGLISVIGFTPDIFIGPISGYFLDTYPGILGFQYVFAGLGIASMCGFVATIAFSKSVNSLKKVKKSR